MTIPSARASCLAAAALWLAACASPGSLRQDLNRLTANNDFAAVVKKIEGAKNSAYTAKNALLYYLDLGMALHLNGQYEASNEAFEEAKRLAKELFTKSVTTEASTFLVSDNTRPYYGEDFERAYIHVFSALNYAMLGRDEDALVEARQVDFLLTKLQTDYKLNNRYKEDAFARYLMGLLYENSGEWNDAYVSYRKALETYGVHAEEYGVAPPRALVGDACRAARKMGFDDKVEEIQKRWGEPPAEALDGNEIVLLNYNGLAPRKVDSFFEIGFLAGWAYVEAQEPQGKEAAEAEKVDSTVRALLANDVVRMAFPKFVPTPYTVRSFSVETASASAGAPELVQNIGAIAAQSLEDRVGRTRAKTIARAVLKFALTRTISDQVKKNNKDNEGWAWLTKAVLQAAAVMTEFSDKRSWQTLPDQIWMDRVPLPPGKHTLRLKFQDAAGATLSERSLPDVEVLPGRKVFVVVRTAQ